MATIKQITDTEGTTHDIGCKWENITDKPEIKDIHVKSDPTTSTYYLCGSTTSESATGTLVKKPNVYVNTNDELVAHAFLGNRVETPTLHLNNGGSSGGKIVFGDTIEDDVEIHDGHYACIEEMEDDVLDFKATAFRFQNEGSFFQFTGGPIIIDEDFPIEGNITGTASYADGSGHADEANHANEADYAGTANCLADKSKGSTIQPVYINTSGRPVACSYSLSKSVPSDAVFTDTKNTVGITTTANKIYLVGATSTSTTTGASANSYSNASVYATNGALTATTFVVAGTKATTSSRITSDASYNLYFTVGGKTPLVIADDNSSNIFVAPGSSYSNRYSLGTSNRLWKDVYATTFYGNLSGNATTANCLADKSKGSSTIPVYINASGRPVACSFNANNFAIGESSNATLPATAGWYRIAVSRASIMNCEGIFQICGEIAGKHTSCIITAGTCYGLEAATNVQVLSCHNWSTSALTKVRIVYNTSYTGNYAYLEVYSSNAAAISLTVRKLDGIGWSLTDPKTAGSIPSGYSSKEVELSNGTIVVPTIKATSNIYTSGSVNASAGFYETSDERLKDFSNRIDVHLDRLAKLKKHYFTWKDSENKEQQIGVSAQEIQELYPEIVSEQDNGTLTVAYDKLSVIALAAIDELHKKNKELEARIELLENKLLT